jgi:hypothetical protein
MAMKVFNRYVLQQDIFKEVSKFFASKKMTHEHIVQMADTVKLDPFFLDAETKQTLLVSSHRYGFVFSQYR